MYRANPEPHLLITFQGPTQRVDPAGTRDTLGKNKEREGKAKAVIRRWGKLTMP